MSDWIRKKKLHVILLMLGALCGFLYWKFVGCSTGTCPLKSHWYIMMPYGMLLGWLIGDLISSFTTKKK